MGKEVKSRNHAVILYPSNPYHVQLLDYFRKTYDGFYIVHDANSDNYNIPFAGYVAEQHDEKKHIHCVIQFKNPRSASGFVKSLPTVRYYKTMLLENVKDEIKQQLFTVYDLPCMDLPVQEIVQPIISHSELINDLFAYSYYLLHKDFKSKMLGKKEYSFNDVLPLACDISHYTDYFMQTDNCDSELLDQCVQIWSCSDGSIDLFMQLVSMHSNKLVKYVQSHAYFLNTFLINKKEVKTYD